MSKRRYSAAKRAREINKAVQARMKGVEVVLEPVNDIPRSANGKFWIQVCNVPQHEIDAVLSLSRSSGIAASSE